MSVDPHASKVSPSDPRLKLPRKKGRSIRKGPVAGVAGLVAGLVLLAISFALMPEKDAVREAGDEAGAAGSFTVPDMIRNAPDYDDPVEETFTGSVSGSETAEVEQFVEPPLSVRARSRPVERGEPQLSSEERELEQALVASPFFDGRDGAEQVMGRQQGGSAGLAGLDLGRLAEASQVPSGLFGEGDPNKQEHKNSFMAGEGGRRDEVRSGGLMEPASPYEIKAGSIIPVSLVTGINSDLPGEIIGQVRENVYDTVSGNYLLIPQGSRLIARYDSMVSYGQSRALVCWNRLIRPDGSSIDLGCAPGVGLDGYAGFEDKVDNHFDRLIGGVLLSSVLSVGATTSQGDWSGVDEMNTGQLFAANTGEEINRAGQQITRKNLNIQPTIKVRPGYSVNVLVNRDLTLEPVGDVELSMR